MYMYVVVVKDRLKATKPCGAPCCAADQMRRLLKQEEREKGAGKTSTPGSARMSGQDAACRAGAWANVKAL